ncbi:hypothetical protein AB0E59_47095 [Lentzea sp. NPDC034063]|uniref:hypothetical protein n=1 Tax=unclassified Lentzea TaxID=2643253 RepID=UPI0033FB1831
MYGLPSPSIGEFGAVSPAFGDYVVYEGSVLEAWGRYRVVEITENPSGDRYSLSTYQDDFVVLRRVSCRSIATIPFGHVHRVLNPVERIEAVLRRCAEEGVTIDIADDEQLSTHVLSLLASNRHVEADAHLLRAEMASGILTAPAFRYRIGQLRIRGNDESYLTSDSAHITTSATCDGTLPGVSSG